MNRILFSTVIGITGLILAGNALAFSYPIPIHNDTTDCKATLTNGRVSVHPGMGSVIGATVPTSINSGASDNIQMQVDGMDKGLVVLQYTLNDNKLLKITYTTEHLKPIVWRLPAGYRFYYDGNGYILTCRK